jgi:hypothetical protein
MIVKSPEWKMPDVAAPIHGKAVVRGASTEVEQLPKKPAASLLASAVIPVIVVKGVLLLIMTQRHPRSLGAPLNDLIELAAIKPDAATLWTIVHLNTLPFRHDQRHFLAYRTLHRFNSR